jgi:Flp pilus assembly pilin Flp
MTVNQKGQGLTEYAVLLSVVAVASIAVTALFGAALKSKIASLGAAISGRSSTDVTAIEKQAQQKSEEARQAAEYVDGMEIGEREVSPASGGRRAGR